MTDEEAIKWINDRMCWGRGKFTEHHPPVFDECWEAGGMAIEALKSRPKWIPCSERLPDNPSPVIITVLWHKPYDNYEVTIGEYWNETEGWGNWENAEIVAWMPLPEPWKGGENNDTRNQNQTRIL